ncbi:MAG: hemerythrin domain-containing protein [Solirubrobacterales bacterium]|nr:hemerythrin domain-containing protein [Solirubrobacterales bacterium]
MKRSEALKPISREHHHTLFVAKEVNDLPDSEVDRARSILVEYWQTEGSPHFRIEEEVLLPGSNVGGPAEDPEIARMLSDHLEIRRRMARVEAGEGDIAEIKGVAGMMRDHCRFEERELFPRIESEMTEEELIPLGEAVIAAEKEHFGGPARRPPRQD